MTYLLTLSTSTQVTPDTHAFRFPRPEGYDFKPGQATELKLQRDGWRDEGRPFTFTSLPDGQELEFVIKSYPSHEGVTDQLATLAPGEQVEIEAPFGAIEDKGPGTFIAAGAGITPFLAILRQRAAQGALDGCRLVFTNKTEADIILHDELAAMPGLTSHFTVTEEEGTRAERALIDKDWLSERIGDFSGRFYLCGPHGFVDDIRDALKALGADPAQIHTEEGW